MRKVRSNGEIRWGGAMIFLSEALIGEPVGIAETEAGDWLVRFADIDLGIIDRRSKSFAGSLPAGRHIIRKSPDRRSGPAPLGPQGPSALRPARVPPVDYLDKPSHPSRRQRGS